MRIRVLLIVGVLAVAGCGGEGDTVRESVPTSTPTTASQFELPLAAYLSTEEELELEQRAASKVQVECAASFGVEMEPAPVDKAAIRMQANFARRYGLVDKDEAALYGYGYPPSENGADGERPPATPQQARIDEAMSGEDAEGNPSKMKDANGQGVPEGGCAAEGWRVVRGDVSYDYDALPRELIEQARQLMMADEEYVQAEQDWAECMSRAGYDFEHPYDAGNSVGEADAETQRSMALLDVGCALETNFPGRAMAIDAGYQKALIEENEAQLRSALEDKRTLMDNVRSVLS